MRQRIIITFFAGILCWGCSKKSLLSEEQILTEHLTSGKWHLRIIENQTIAPDSITYVNQPITIIDCLKDDFYLYSEKGSFLWDQGSSKCDPEIQQVYFTGKWHLDKEHSKLNSLIIVNGEDVNKTFSILKLTADSLILTQDPIPDSNFRLDMNNNSIVGVIIEKYSH